MSQEVDVAILDELHTALVGSEGVALGRHRRTGLGWSAAKCEPPGVQGAVRSRNTLGPKEAYGQNALDKMEVSM
eukprot:3398577-Heterocapsa_arctica.AAC.1